MGQNGVFWGVPEMGFLGGIWPGPDSATLARFLGVFRGAGALLINVFFGQVLVCFFVRGSVRGARVCARCAGVCADRAVFLEEVKSISSIRIHINTFLKHISIRISISLINFIFPMINFTTFYISYITCKSICVINSPNPLP